MSSGFLTRFGFAMETQITAPTWPSTSPATLTALQPVLAPTPAGEATLATYPSTVTYGPRDSAVVQTLPANLTLPLPVTYAGLEPLWTCALGYQAKRISGTVYPATITAGAYRHRFEIDNVLQAEHWTTADGWESGDGLTSGQRKTRRLTLAGTIGDVSAWEWLSAMVGQLDLQVQAGQAMQMTLSFVAGSLDETPAANTLAALQALTVPTAARVFWHQSVLRLATYSSSVVLDSDDIIACSQFRLTLDNALDVPYSERISQAPDEPGRGERPPTIRGTLTVPRYTADTLLSAQRAGTAHMMDLIFTGGQIGATGQTYTLELYLPMLYFTTASPVWNNAGVISQTLAFEAVAPSTAAAGMPTTIHATPLIVQCQTADNTHYLE